MGVAARDDDSGEAPAGEFGYDLAADLNLGEYRSVVVYCKAFSTIFSVATLAET